MDEGGRLGFILDFCHLWLPATFEHSLYILIASHLVRPCPWTLAPGMPVCDRFCQLGPPLRDLIQKTAVGGAGRTWGRVSFLGVGGQ